MKKISSLFLAALLLASCSEENMEREFASDSEVKLCFQGKDILRYDQNGFQLMFNRDHCEFALISDDASTFYRLTLNSLPEREGQTVTGDVEWASATSYECKKNITFNVTRIEGYKIWFWNSDSRTGVVAEMLE